MRALLTIYFPVFLIGLLASCEKPDFTNDPSLKLRFSTQEVLFDTVFTTVGSATQSFKVFNRNQKNIRIDEVKLMGGANSPFRINVDGKPAKSVKEHPLLGGDSMFIFVEVTIDPNSDADSFFVKDSIRFITNTNTQYVRLIAFGHNAHFYDSYRVTQDTTWTQDLPHVIYNYVIVDSNVCLTIEEGAKIHSHRNAGIFVFGCLKVLGTAKDKVTFLSDRLENYYNNNPGQWQGIRLFPSSSGNIIDHAIIRNGVTGIQADSLTPDQSPKLVLSNTRIENMSGVGLAGFSANVQVSNTIISNCCQALVYAPFGGTYSFFQCTFGGNNCVCTPEQAALLFANKDFQDQQGTTTSFDLNVIMFNSILWGNRDDELVINDEGSGKVNLGIEYSLLKSNIKGLEDNHNIIDKDPKFDKPCDYNYELKKGSPALDQGGNIRENLGNEGVLLLQKDHKGEARDIDEPDMGALEGQG